MSGPISCVRADIAEHGSILRSLPCGHGFGVSCRLGEELFEIFKQVWCLIEQKSDLRVNFLNGLRLALVCLQDLQELLIDVWLTGISCLQKSVFDVFKLMCILYLDLVDIADSMIEFHGSSFFDSYVLVSVLMRTIQGLARQWSYRSARG